MLGTSQVAERLGVSVATVKRWLKDGKIPSAKFGRDYKVTEEDLQNFINQSKNKLGGF